MIDHPITLKEYAMPSLNTTRQDYINDKNRKYGGSSKFSFRKYKTDKERLEDLLRVKAENQKHVDFLKEKENVNQENPKNYYSIVQPTMRYKPRTDIERIYCTVNEYSYGKISKDIVNDQLSKLDLNNLKKKEEDHTMENSLLDKYKNIDEHVIEELQTQKDFLNRQGYNEKNSETVKQIEMILSNCQQKANEIKTTSGNSDDKGSGNKSMNKTVIKNQINSDAAKMLMGEYNMKTFFKAASVISFNLDDYKHADKKEKDRFLNNNSRNDKKSLGNNRNINNSTSLNFFKSGKLTNYNLTTKNSNNYDNENSNNYFNINNTNLNTQASGPISNRTKNNFYLTFTEMDEPYYDEIRELKQNTLSKGKKNSISNTQINLQKDKDGFNNLDTIQKKIFLSTKANFSKTAQGNFLTEESQKNKIFFNNTERNMNKMSNLIISSEFNSSNNFNFDSNTTGNQNIDEKSLLYLKKISAFNSLLQSDNKEEENRRENGFKANSQLMKNVKLNLKSLKDSLTFVNKKPEGLCLRQDMEENRKCIFSF